MRRTAPCTRLDPPPPNRGRRRTIGLLRGLTRAGKAGMPTDRYEPTRGWMRGPSRGQDGSPMLKEGLTRGDRPPTVPHPRIRGWTTTRDWRQS